MYLLQNLRVPNIHYLSNKISKKFTCMSCIYAWNKDFLKYCDFRLCGKLNLDRIMLSIRKILSIAIQIQVSTYEQIDILQVRSGIAVWYKKSYTYLRMNKSAPAESVILTSPTEPITIITHRGCKSHTPISFFQVLHRSLIVPLAISYES